jgi:hypothetical protein
MDSRLDVIFPDKHIGNGSWKQDWADIRNSLKKYCVEIYNVGMASQYCSESLEGIWAL